MATSVAASNSILSRVTQWVTVLSFFLVPLFFLPFTAGVLDQSKQMLLVLLASIGLVSWLAGMVSSRQFSFRAGWLNVLPALFLVFVLVSSIFSITGYQTWIGSASQEYTSFLSVVVFVILFYVFANTSSSLHVGRNVLIALLLSATLSGAVSLLGMFNLVHLPFAFAASTGFNTIGTLNTLALFLMVVMFLGLATSLVSSNGGSSLIEKNAAGMFTRILIVLVSLMTLVVLFVINYWMFWVMAIVGVFLLTLFGFLQPDEFPNSKTFALPLVILVVSILFLFLPSPLHLNIPLVVSPSFGASVNIAYSALKTNVRDIFFGTGPGTYLNDYTLLKPVSVNASPLWSLSFDQSKSAFLTMLPTIGSVGTLTWLILMGWILMASLKRLLKEKNHETWKITYVFFVGWVLLLLSQFLDRATFTSTFLLWGLTGLLAAQLLGKMWKADFSRSPKLGLAASFVFVIVAVGVVAGLFVTGERYAADVAFAKAVTFDQKQAGVQKVIPELQTAIQLSPMNDEYVRNLSSAYLGEVRKQIAALNGAKPTTDQTTQISQLVSASVQAAEQAARLEPRSVQNWSYLGSVYQAVIPFVQNAGTLSVQAYANASVLEPSSPVHQTNLGTLYLAVADQAETLKTSTQADVAKSAKEEEPKLLSKAEDSLNAAIKLKNDYLQAHYYLAAVYERQGKLDQATARLVALAQATPQDVGLGFELSQLYLRTKQYDLAGQELDHIIAVNPKYSNALWYRASVYEIQNNHDKAIELVKQVVTLNPDNKDAQTRLSALQSGQTTTTIPSPINADGTTTDTVVNPSSAATPPAAADATKK